MNFKIKTTHTDYNKETGISTATVATEIGVFNGIAKLNPEDKEIASKYAGCRYAEMRAILAYIREKIKILNHQLKTIDKITHRVKSKKVYDPIFKILEEEKKTIKDDITILKIRQQSLSSKLNEIMESRPKIIEEIQKKKQDNE